MEQPISNLTVMKTLLIITMLLFAVALLANSGIPAPKVQSTDDGLSPPALFQKPPLPADTLVKPKNPQLSIPSAKEDIKTEDKVIPAKPTLSKTTADTISRSDKVHDNSRLGSVEYLLRWINLLLKVT